jgi:16S rRNA (cytosine967-C5)-methyltransferase
VWRERLDHSLRAYSSRPLESLETTTLDALRLGAVQLLVLEMPPYAALDSTIGAIRDRGRRGYVNAVLRKLADRGEPPHESLSTEYSHPESLVRRWLDRYGKSSTESLLEWNNGVPPLGAYDFAGTSLLSPGVQVGGEFLERFVRLERSGPGVLQGRERRGLYVQDEGAAIVGEGFAELAEGSALEIGAAPGGKTVHICHSSSPPELLLCLDSSADRMRTWLENGRRLCPSLLQRSVFGIVSRAEDLSPFEKGQRFDTVIIDAPCTNTGVYRRRHSARWRWSLSLLEECVAIQRSLLESAADLVSPGGGLAYSTCSLEPEENGGMVEWFESRRAGFRRIDFPAPSQLVREGLLDIFPPDRGFDGHFAAAWIRTEA